MGNFGMEGLSLLQAGQRTGTLKKDNVPSCTPLRNRGTHFTVEIEVGTPGQKFDVVADTGSDNVIVASCICNDNGRCRKQDKCFRGTNRSSTFDMAGILPNGQMTALVLTFGSGQIEAILASDMVRVGQVQTRMDSSVLLMVDQALAISGPFEGILGLGLPSSVQLAEEDEGASKAPASPFSSRQKAGKPKPGGFLEKAGIDRFSMCFNDQSDGVLRLATAEEPGALGSIGQFHWGLDFRGISVGSESNPVAFCQPSTMAAGQATPCGAIPDSGTTVMMADPHHLRTLFTQLCDTWPRCQKGAAEQTEYEKFEFFQVLLMECEDWMGLQGLAELPPIHFHLVGAGGNERTLQLNATSYVFATREDEVHYVTKNLFGIFPVKVAVPTGRKRNVCMPAFASHKYNTQKNGPVWILGTPLFYEFQVGYDLKASPPAITFDDKPCGSCSSPALLSANAERSGQKMRSGMPREVHGPLRIPSLDLERPL